MCGNIGGHLPEPRDEQENLFLDSLGADTFVLGINDKMVEGQWVFDTDGLPLTWLSWVKWVPEKYPDAPREGRDGNCAAMLCHQSETVAGHRSQDWRDFACSSTDYMEEGKKSLVCQKG